MSLRFAACSPLLLVAACLGGHPATLPPLAPPAVDPVTVIYLVGDAGVSDPRREPVFEALTEDIRGLAGAVDRRMVFLGDNIYPRGLPELNAPNRAESERRLMAQMHVALDTGTPTVMVPGNHDWDKSGPDGFNAVFRQGEFVEAMGEGLVEVLPLRGCPGPVVRDVGESARLVFLDTEWWLRIGDKPEHPTSDCPADAREEVLAQLGDVLRSADGRHVVVAGHHPFLTGGPHGGRFGISQHIFPLRDWKSWLWVPLPVIGSIYPIARMSGFTNQDLSGGRNEVMRIAIGSILEANPPLVYAAGHTHGLEVFDGEDQAGVIVTSGAGNYGHVSSLAWLDDTLFAGDKQSGYMKLELEAGGRARLSVITVDQDARRTEVFAIDVEAPGD